jgi:hypothetical protein
MIGPEVSEHFFRLEICPSTIQLFYAAKITWPSSAGNGCPLALIAFTYL